MLRLTAFLFVMMLVCLAGFACGSDKKAATPAPSPAGGGAIQAAEGTARLPGPRMFEALAQAATGIVLVQVDVSGLVHVEFEDAQRVSRAKNCRAEGTPSFKEALAVAQGVTSANTKLPPEAAASMLGMFQVPESGGLERLVLSGTGTGSFADEGRATISRFIASIAEGCRP